MKESVNEPVSRLEAAPTTARWTVIGAVLITAFTALIIALGIYVQRDQVRWTVTNYSVVDDQTVEVGFDVQRPENTAVVCRVRAIAIDFSAVGSVDVTIPANEAGGASSVRRDVTVRTTTRANTGTVSNCVIEGARSE